jgi:hypothetical protein
MTEQKHEQPESDAENPSLTDTELEQVVGGGGALWCQIHGEIKPCGKAAPHIYV